MNYIYNYSCHEDEISLCALEMRAIFGEDTKSHIMESTMKIDPSRSPFIRERMGVIFEGDTLQDIIKQLKDLLLTNSSFKVVFVKKPDLDESEQPRFAERRKIEREIGLQISGTADLHNPDVLFGIMFVNGRWVFGEYVESEPVWLRHQEKPRNYSTALSTRVARAIVNIAVPDPIETKAIDPCCGIGTVLVEGLSMGVDIVGSDMNPLVVPGARENIAHFGLNGEVFLKDMLTITDHYDVAIIDMPYNLCSVITHDEQLKMLHSARNFADRVVIITIEPIDPLIKIAGFEIVDRCIVKKGKFSRQVIVCI